MIGRLPPPTPRRHGISKRMVARMSSTLIALLAERQADEG
jgi:hypothetical protein